MNAQEIEGNIEVHFGLKGSRTFLDHSDDPGSLAKPLVSEKIRPII